MTNKLSYHDYKYFDLIRNTFYDGIEKSDRTGTGTISHPFQQAAFDISDGTIPLLTSKRMFIRGVIHELLWYISGDRNTQYLNDNNVHIWDEWADQHGDLGPIYGSQWRNWTGLTDSGTVNTTDQLAQIIDKLINNPTDRGIIISSWNVSQLNDMNLRPCHCMLQFWSDGEQLQSHLYQRSADIGIGVPFNIVQYSIFTYLIGQVTGLMPTKFIWTGGDVHVYKNHVDALYQQVSRIPYPSPTISLNTSIDNIEQFGYDDIQINDYQHHPSIKMEVSV